MLLRFWRRFILNAARRLRSADGEALLPCPGCGSRNLAVDYDSVTDTHHVVCLSCKMRGSARLGADRAVRYWNELPREK